MSRKAERALTLLEVMAAVAILGIVYTYLARAATEGILTASDSATGGTFSFMVRNAALAGHLQPAISFDTQGIPGSSTFSMTNIQDVPPDWAENCCTLVGEATGGVELERRK